MTRSILKQYNEGRQDGYENKPKAKGLKGDNKRAYENGYAEGHEARSAIRARGNEPPRSG